MEPVHIFYKELPIDQNNTFTANIAQENEVKEVKFKKSREYAVTDLFINQVIDSIVFAITDTDRQEPISSFILKLIKGKKETVLDLKIYNEEMTLDKIIPFQKIKKKTATELPLIKLTSYNTTTKSKKKLDFLIT